MYNIPKNFNINGFIGQNVQQICYSLNTISVLFESGDYVTIRGMFKIDINGKESIVEILIIDQDHGILKLLEQKVTSVNTNSNRTDLVLQFGPDYALHLLGDDFFESYTISIGKDDFTV